MSRCDDLLDRIEAAGVAELPDDLAAHAHGCEGCREALARAQGLEEAGHAVRGIRPSAELVARIKTLHRLPLACEHAIASINEALDGELDMAGREALLGHLHGCPACQTAWEALATLQEVGRTTAVAPRLRARLVVHPRTRVERRRRPRFFDLRLATAAAYLVAAMTIMLIGNPATIARASSASVERAQLYTRAAVENRLDSLTRRARTAALSAQDWFGDTARKAWNQANRLLRPRAANPAPPARVSSGRDGGKQS